VNAAAIEQRLDNIERLLKHLTAAFVVSAPVADAVAEYVSPAREFQIRQMAREAAGVRRKRGV